MLTFATSFFFFEFYLFFVESEYFLQRSNLVTVKNFMVSGCSYFYDSLVFMTPCKYVLHTQNVNGNKVELLIAEIYLDRIERNLYFLVA